MKSKIAIFASGAGSNARRLIEFFNDHSKIEVSLIVCNRRKAGVYEVANAAGVEILHFPKEKMENSTELLETLNNRSIEWIVLAGFLLKIPHSLIEAYEGRMLNVHPALLPKFGGKGMYGDYVHQAVLEADVKKSGISIHYVDANYDTGSLIRQYECEIEKGETVESLRAKIQGLEHEFLPRVVEELIQ